MYKICFFFSFLRLNGNVRDPFLLSSSRRVRPRKRVERRNIVTTISLQIQSGCVRETRVSHEDPCRRNEISPFLSSLSLARLEISFMNFTPGITDSVRLKRVSRETIK